MQARTHGKRALALSVAAGLVALAAPFSATAAVELGQTGTPTTSCGINDSLVQSVHTPSTSYAVPAGGGVITDWSFQASTTGQTAKLMVFRPTAVPSQFVVVGKSALATFTAGVRLTSPTRIPVQEGDLLGMRTQATGGGNCMVNGGGAANRIRFKTPQDPADPPDGATLNLNEDYPDLTILVAASVEPDCDFDGFGDETQDPELAAIQACDPNAPVAMITGGPRDKTRRKQATFGFTGSDARAIASFQCSLDGAAFTSCISPHTVRVKKGKHTFQVRAVDQAGNVGSPVSDDWKVKKKKRRK
jgi:hypothetical protein